jgi:hypothetical protein
MGFTGGFTGGECAAAFAASSLNSCAVFLSSREASMGMDLIPTRKGAV